MNTGPEEASRSTPTRSFSCACADFARTLAAGGIAREVAARLHAMGALAGPKRFRGTFVVFEPEAVKRVLDQIVQEAGVEVLLHALAIGAERDGNAIRSVTIQDRNGAHRV